jgi:hypothetical protein
MRHRLFTRFPGKNTANSEFCVVVVFFSFFHLSSALTKIFKSHVYDDEKEETLYWLELSSSSSSTSTSSVEQMR